MNDYKPYDPRAIANTILLEARSSEYEVTNLSLQKLLYLVHSIFLIEHNSSLVSGHFEAWQYGPVHPAVYEAFKAFGREPIQCFAQAYNYSTLSFQKIDEVEDVAVKRIVKRVINTFGGMSPSQLVNLTHAKGGAWDKTVNKAETSIALGLRINNTDTKELYGKMKLDLSQTSNKDVHENTPFT